MAGSGQIHAAAGLPPGKTVRYELNSRLGGSWSRSAHLEIVGIWS
jgi:hypothetical protein